MEDDEGARGQMRGRHGGADYILTPVAADIWRIEQMVFSPFSGIMTFGADGKSLRLDFGRMRHLRFEKTPASHRPSSKPLATS